MSGLAYVPSTDGVEVAVHDLGGDGPPLLLAHATGFCGGVLAPMAAALDGSFHAWAIDIRGHGETVTPATFTDDTSSDATFTGATSSGATSSGATSSGATSSGGGVDFQWTGFSDDVLAVVDGLGLGLGSGGVYGFGHSSGGAAVLDAEARRPGTFRALYCYEPIVWPSPPPPGSRDALITRARRRRQTFPSRDEARANFSGKHPVSGFAPDALEAYLDCAFSELADGSLRLRCRGEWEAAIYRQGLVHDGFSRLASVTCPVVVASGDRWEAVDRDVVDRQAAALPHARIQTFPGLGHLGPMEDPPTVAAAVAQAFSA